MKKAVIISALVLWLVSGTGCGPSSGETGTASVTPPAASVSPEASGTVKATPTVTSAETGKDKTDTKNKGDAKSTTAPPPAGKNDKKDNAGSDKTANPSKDSGSRGGTEASGNDPAGSSGSRDNERDDAYDEARSEFETEEVEIPSGDAPESGRKSSDGAPKGESGDNQTDSPSGDANQNPEESPQSTSPETNANQWEDGDLTVNEDGDIVLPELPI